MKIPTWKRPHSTIKAHKSSKLSNFSFSHIGEKKTSHWRIRWERGQEEEGILQEENDGGEASGDGIVQQENVTLFFWC